MSTHTCSSDFIIAFYSYMCIIIKDNHILNEGVLMDLSSYVNYLEQVLIGLQVEFYVLAIILGLYGAVTWKRQIKAHEVNSQTRPLLVQIRVFLNMLDNFLPNRFIYFELQFLDTGTDDIKVLTQIQNKANEFIGGLIKKLDFHLAQLYDARFQLDFLASDNIENLFDALQREVTEMVATLSTLRHDLMERAERNIQQTNNTIGSDGLDILAKPISPHISEMKKLARQIEKKVQGLRK